MTRVLIIRGNTDADTQGEHTSDGGRDQSDASPAEESQSLSEAVMS